MVVAAHPAEGADGRLYEALQVLRDRQVALDGERSDPLRLALENLPPASEHGHVGALAGEGLGDRETHAGRCAADDRSPAGEPELRFRVASANDFPTASGLASSASGYAALALAVSNPTVLRLFEITKLDSTFDIQPTRQAALERVQAAGGSSDGAP